MAAAVPGAGCVGKREAAFGPCRWRIGATRLIGLKASGPKHALKGISQRPVSGVWIIIIHSDRPVCHHQVEAPEGVSKDSIDRQRHYQAALLWNEPAEKQLVIGTPNLFEFDADFLVRPAWPASEYVQNGAGGSESRWAFFPTPCPYPHIEWRATGVRNDALGAKSLFALDRAVTLLSGKFVQAAPFRALLFEQLATLAIARHAVAYRLCCQRGRALFQFRERCPDRPSE